MTQTQITSEVGHLGPFSTREAAQGKIDRLLTPYGMVARVQYVRPVGSSEWDEDSSESRQPGYYLVVSAAVVETWDRGIREAKALGLSGDALIAHRHKVHAEATARL